jgi:hypothetical protein
MIYVSDDILRKPINNFYITKPVQTVAAKAIHVIGISPIRLITNQCLTCVPLLLLPLETSNRRIKALHVNIFFFWHFDPKTDGIAVAERPGLHCT